MDREIQDPQVLDVTKTLKVLLVDDNEADNFLHRYLLRPFAEVLEVADALDGTEAVAKLVEERKAGAMPNLVFLDLNMPRMGGFEVLDILERWDPAVLAGTHIYVLTTSINPEDEARAERFRSLAGFLTKPLEGPMFESIVERHFPEVTLPIRH